MMIIALISAANIHDNKFQESIVQRWDADGSGGPSVRDAVLMQFQMYRIYTQLHESIHNRDAQVKYYPVTV